MGINCTCLRSQSCFVSAKGDFLMTGESLPPREVEVEPDPADLPLQHSPTPTFMNSIDGSNPIETPSEPPSDPRPYSPPLTLDSPQPAHTAPAIVSTPPAFEVYEGEYRSFQRHGHGVCCFPDGRRYSGNWEMGDITGFGRMEWPDGRKYEGHFVKGLKHGGGMFKWKDGRSYDGEWQADLQHGSGVFTSADGEQIHGIWRHGKRL